jgi:hypothetical protein
MIRKIKKWLGFGRLPRASRGPRLRLANIAEATHGDGNITKKVDAVQALRHVLVNIGSDIDHVAVTTAGTEIPLGVCDDEAAAIEDNINVQLLGQKEGTILMVAHAAITAGDMLVAAAAGRVQTLTGLGAATYYIVGRALNAATTQDDLVEVAHCVPVQRVVT